MPSPKHPMLPLAACAGALLLPAGEAGAAGLAVSHADAIDPVVELAQRAHARAATRNVRLHRATARLRGRRASRDRTDLRDWTTAHLRVSNAGLARSVRRLRRSAARVAVPPVLQAIAVCESGGDPRAIGGGGLYRGKYQFDRQTWASLGGSGDPAAAPEAEQDRRAAALFARAGTTPWPTCGG